MKKVMKRIWTVAMLAIVSTVAMAQEEGETPQTEEKPAVQVDLNESYAGGKVEVTNYGDPKEDGSVVVTITVTPNVTPDESYIIAKDDIVVVLTRATSQTRDDNPSIAEPLELGGDDPEDLSTKRDYTFTVPFGFGAWVKEANFSKVETPVTNDISKDDGSKAPSSVTWDYAENVLSIKGTGATRDFTAEDIPWKDNLTNINSVVIDKDVTSLGDNIFAGCTNLATITIENDEQVVAMGKNAIPAIEGLQIDVPGNLYNEYKVTEGWDKLTIISSTGVDMGIKFGDNNSYDTFFSTDVLKVPSKLFMYVISNISEKGLELTEVKGVLPAKTPVLVYSEKLKGDDFKTAKTTSEATVGTNLLKVVMDEKGKDVKLGDVWLLYNDVFYYTQAGNIPQNVIYMAKPEEQPEEQPLKARSYYPIAPQGEKTAIMTLRTDGTIATTPQKGWYSLDGRKYDTMPTRKGIYIKDGKKIVIK